MSIEKLEKILKGEDVITIPLDTGKRKAVLSYSDGQLISVYEYHETPDGDPCGGSVFVTYEDVGYKGEEWYVRDDRPFSLTLEPSIDCNDCPSHGYITDGKWTQGFYPPVPLTDGSSEPLQNPLPVVSEKPTLAQRLMSFLRGP